MPCFEHDHDTLRSHPARYSGPSFVQGHVHRSQRHADGIEDSGSNCPGPADTARSPVSGESRVDRHCVAKPIAVPFPDAVPGGSGAERSLRTGICCQKFLAKFLSRLGGGLSLPGSWEWLLTLAGLLVWDAWDFDALGLPLDRR
jgi:hypothetical protein